MPTTSATANGAASAASSGRPVASAASSPSAASDAKACSRAVPYAASRPATGSRGLGAVGSPQRGEILGRRCRHRRDDLLDHRSRAHPPDPQLGPEHEPVRERGDRDGLHVVGVSRTRGPPSAACARASFITARLPRGLAPTSTLRARRASRPRGRRRSARRSRRRAPLERALHRDERLGRHDGLERDVVGAAVDALREHRPTRSRASG